MEKLKKSRNYKKYNYNNKSNIWRNGRTKEQDLEHQDQENNYNPGYRTSLLSSAGGEGSQKKAPKLPLL